MTEIKDIREQLSNDWVVAHFNRKGVEEFYRMDALPRDRISHHLHCNFLDKYISPGDRVLEIGAGAGRYTIEIAKRGASVVCTDISPVQVNEAKKMVDHFGYGDLVQAYDVADVRDLSKFYGQEFDLVLAYGGPYGYVFEERKLAMEQTLRCIRSHGHVVGSVMSLWGTIHSGLPGVLNTKPIYNEQITLTGDLTSDRVSQAAHYCHLFTSDDLREFLISCDLKEISLAASGVLGTLQSELLQSIENNSPEHWQEMLRMERQASVAEGCLNMGRHLLFGAKKI